MPAVPFAKRSAATADLDDEGAAEREPSIATSEAEQQESDDDAIDTARVKRPKVDHVEANTDFITFDEASDDEHEAADEMQDDQVRCSLFTERGDPLITHGWLCRMTLPAWTVSKSTAQRNLSPALRKTKVDP